MRDRDEVAAAHPGVRYETLDLLGTDPAALGEILREVVDEVERGELASAPVTALDVRRGSEALQLLSQARHVGKVVLSVPHALDPDGTVLVTGGTGGLGALVAEHLARAHASRHLLLASRSGPGAAGAAELRARLAEHGCEATIAACDVGDRGALAELLKTVDPRHPLTAVVHAAGTFDDAMVESLDAASLDAVMRPKSGAARALDELTASHDLAAFVLFSSAAATFGLPGQGNYAAANAYLDALAARRRAAGRPATSVAWGVWQLDAGMTGRLTALDVERLEQGTRQRPMAPALALAPAGCRSRAPRARPGRAAARPRDGARPGTVGRAPAAAVGGRRSARAPAGGACRRAAAARRWPRDSRPPARRRSATRSSSSSSARRQRPPWATPPRTPSPPVTRSRSSASTRSDRSCCATGWRRSRA